MIERVFGLRLPLPGAVLLVFLLAALWAARPSSGAAPEAPPGGRDDRQHLYTVRPGDTLWSIAAKRYDGDPRKAVWRIQERNGLAGAALLPGEVIVLP
jgi:nucleoid-associated protein YgaU